MASRGLRYHLSQGDNRRAKAVSQMAGDTGSRRGLELLSEWHERQGRYAEAEALLRRIEDRYDNTVRPRYTAPKTFASSYGVVTSSWS